MRGFPALVLLLALTPVAQAGQASEYRVCGAYRLNPRDLRVSVADGEEPGVAIERMKQAHRAFCADQAREARELCQLPMEGANGGVFECDPALPVRCTAVKEAEPDLLYRKSWDPAWSVQASDAGPVPPDVDCGSLPYSSRRSPDGFNWDVIQVQGGFGGSRSGVGVGITLPIGGGTGLTRPGSQWVSLDRKWTQWVCACAPNRSSPLTSVDGKRAIRKFPLSSASARPRGESPLPSPDPGECLSLLRGLQGLACGKPGADPRGGLLPWKAKRSQLAPDAFVSNWGATHCDEVACGDRTLRVLAASVQSDRGKAGLCVRVGSELQFYETPLPVEPGAGMGAELAGLGGPELARCEGYSSRQVPAIRFGVDASGAQGVTYFDFATGGARDWGLGKSEQPGLPNAITRIPTLSPSTSPRTRERCERQFALSLWKLARDDQVAAKLEALRAAKAPEWAAVDRACGPWLKLSDAKGGPWITPRSQSGSPAGQAQDGR